MPLNDTGRGRRSGDLFLPDFCTPGAVLAVVLVAELVALVLAIASSPGGLAFWDGLARLSLFLLWLALLSAAALCAIRPRLAALSPAAVTAVAMILVIGIVAVVSAAAWWAGRWWAGLPAVLSAPAGSGPASFVLKNVTVAGIVTGLLLRYFWVTAQWRKNVEAEARARIDALQARMRPHFLFNSMNTIAALTRADARLAEEAVEDLADLFRASLSDAAATVTLKEELELTRIYQRIEQHRLGDRLRVEWRVEGLPMRARVPALSIQPLVENAIYHGIEPLADGGTVRVEGRYDEATGLVEVAVENPLPGQGRSTPREGNRIALANLVERFDLAWGGKASVAAATDDGTYRVTLRFPGSEEAP
jgi:two-component system sensor histidine kinase AlgZ